MGSCINNSYLRYRFAFGSLSQDFQNEVLGIQHKQERQVSGITSNTTFSNPRWREKSNQMTKSQEDDPEWLQTRQEETSASKNVQPVWDASKPQNWHP
jgi:hypothetical protein